MLIKFCDDFLRYHWIKSHQPNVEKSQQGTEHISFAHDHYTLYNCRKQDEI